MTILSIGELLKRAGEFENRVEQYYAAIRDQTEDSGVRLLTYYLCRHRRHIKQALEDFDTDEADKICEELLMYAVEFHPERKFHCLDTNPCDIKGQELIECAVSYNEDLIRLYRNILAQPISGEAKLLLESLICIEEKDIVMLKKMLAMHYF
jgi:hypothetical protein